MSDMSEFRITYDGPALQSSQMDVNELAPALLAMGDFLTASATALYGDKIQPQINVKASFKTGSFGIDLVLNTGLIEHIVSILASKETTASVNALNILYFTGLLTKKGTKGLIQVLRQLRGRKVTKVGLKENNAILTVDGEQIEVELEVLELLKNTEVRQALENTLTPLKREGITEFYSGTDTEIHETIAASEADWYAFPIIEENLIIDEIRQMIFSIVSLAFKEDNKWRLNDGNATISALMSDKEFLEKVNANRISFSKGDVLVCDVQVKQWQTTKGAKTEYEVIKVIDHKRALSQQMQLPGL